MEQVSFSWLQDFDWSLRLVLSSDSISALRKPLLMLELRTKLADGSSSQQLIELTTEQLAGLIETLKATQKVNC